MRFFAILLLAFVGFAVASEVYSIAGDTFEIFISGNELVLVECKSLIVCQREF